MIYAPMGLGGNVGIGFAVPSDTVDRIVTQIITHGPNARPSLGLGVLPDARSASSPPAICSSNLREQSSLTSSRMVQPKLSVSRRAVLESCPVASSLAT